MFAFFSIFSHYEKCKFQNIYWVWLWPFLLFVLTFLNSHNFLQHFYIADTLFTQHFTA